MMISPVVPVMTALLSSARDTEQAPGPAQHLRFCEGQAGRRSGEKSDERGGIAADVEDAAATLRRIVDARNGVDPGAPAEGRAQVHDLADSTVRDERQDAGNLRVATVHERLGPEPSLLTGDLDHRLDLGGGQRGRLFAEDRLAVAEGQDGEFSVRGIAGGDVDSIDLGVGDEVGVGCVDAPDAVARREGLTPASVRAGHGKEPRFGYGVQRRGDVARDGARADDAPVDDLHDDPPGFPAG